MRDWPVKQHTAQAAARKVLFPWRKGRRTWTFAVAGIFLTAFAAHLYRSQAKPHGPLVPILYVANPTVQLGVLSLGETREVAFPIVNKGNQRLVVNEIVAGCGGCDRVRRTLLIPPGAAKDFTVSIDTRFDTGAFEKLTKLRTSDPTKPQLDLRVKGWVDPTEKPDADQRPMVSVLNRRR
jgi:hypothetical protein